MTKFISRLYFINLIFVLIGFTCSIFNITEILLPILSVVAILGILSNVLAGIYNYVYYKKIDISVIFDIIVFSLLLIIPMINIKENIALVMIGIIFTLICLSCSWRFYDVLFYLEDIRNSKEIKNMTSKFFKKVVKEPVEEDEKEFENILGHMFRLSQLISKKGLYKDAIKEYNITRQSITLFLRDTDADKNARELLFESLDAISEGIEELQK